MSCYFFPLSVIFTCFFTILPVLPSHSFHFLLVIIFTIISLHILSSFVTFFLSSHNFHFISYFPCLHLSLFLLSCLHFVIYLPLLTCSVVQCPALDRSAGVLVFARQCSLASHYLSFLSCCVYFRLRCTFSVFTNITVFSNIYF